MSQATLFGAPAPVAAPSPAPSPLASLDRAVLAVYLRHPAPTWRETGACIDHLRGRGRLSLVSGIDDDGVTVGWGPRETPHVFLTVTNPSVHQAVADLCRMLLGDSSPP